MSRKALPLVDTWKPNEMVEGGMELNHFKGKWVRLSDYRKLQVENARLRKVINEAHGLIGDCTTIETPGCNAYALLNRYVAKEGGGYERA